eukprot:Nk52_evm1s1670 gene=Nk52_evmTU1s1670
MEDLLYNDMDLLHGPTPCIPTRKSLLYRGHIAQIPPVHILQASEMLRGGWVLPHDGVHGGAHHQRLGGVPCPHCAGEEVITQAQGDFSEGVCVQRGYKEEISPCAEVNVQYRVANLCELGPFVRVGEEGDGEICGWVTGELIPGEKMERRLGGDDFDIKLIM